MLESSEVARRALARSLGKTAAGAARVALGLAIFGAVVDVVSYARLPEGAGGQGATGALVWRLLGQVVLVAVVRATMSPGLHMIYRDLLTRGQLVDARVTAGPMRLAERFASGGSSARAVQTVVAIVEMLVGRFLPTRVVTFEITHDGRSHGGLSGALRADEAIVDTTHAQALIDPARPTRAWLAREPGGRGA